MVICMTISVKNDRTNMKLKHNDINVLICVGTATRLLFSDFKENLNMN